MSDHFFDVIILGDSLASSIAGALLAKGGCRVLTFRRKGKAPSSWFFSSLHLERLLEYLGGRTCFSPPSRFQLLSSRHRVDFHGERTLEEELQREFPVGFPSLSTSLEELYRLGQRLEEILWELGGLPLLGMGSRLRFAKKCLGSRLSLRDLSQPFSTWLARLPSEPDREALAALFSGLSLLPSERLTLSEAALLWGGASRPDGVSEPALEQLLKLRYEQFQGTYEDFDAIAPLERDGNAIAGLTIKNKGACRGSHFLLGDPAALPFFPEQFRSEILTFPEPARWTASRLEGKLSPLLAPRAVLNGDPVLRLVLEQEGPFLSGRIEAAASPDNSSLSREELCRRLALPLPFASPEIIGTFSPPPTSPFPPLRFPHPLQPIRAARNLWLCHGPSLFPSLGTIGEAITGITLANHLLRVKK